MVLYMYGRDRVKERYKMSYKQMKEHLKGMRSDPVHVTKKEYQIILDAR